MAHITRIAKRGSVVGLAVILISGHRESALTRSCLEPLSERFQRTPVALTRHIMAFYGDSPQPSAEDRRRRKRWARVERALQELRTTSQAEEPRPASNV